MAYSTETRVFPIDPNTPDHESIRIAADLIRQGKLVAFPTETVYGLGANALDAEAIDRIYRAKRRPASDPVIAHISDMAQLEQLAHRIPSNAYELAAAFWPGALTLVLQRAPHVPQNIATGLQTVAVRMPAHPVAQALIQAAGVPIAAPSANTFTHPSATTAEHVLLDLRDHVDLILDGGQTQIGLESTVLDLTSETPLVLRPGGVLLDDLKLIIPDVKMIERYTNEDEPTSAPGQMLKHYSPKAEVTLFTGPLYSVLIAIRQMCLTYQEQGRRVGLLLAEEDCHHLGDVGVVFSLGKRADLKTISHNLFVGLRELDAQQVDVILTRDFGRTGLGAALWDRLVRAAEGHVIKVR